MPDDIHPRTCRCMEAQAAVRDAINLTPGPRRRRHLLAALKDLKEEINARR